MSCYVVVVAAGSGKRMAADRPKQFLKVGALPVLTVTLMNIYRIPFISGIVLVVPKQHIEDVRQSIIAPYGVKKIEAVVAGGETRCESVFKGLTALLKKNAEYVLIHDGVRPFCSEKIWNTVYEGLQQFDAVIPGVPMSDTLKKIDDQDCVLQTLERAKVWSVQTPQGFKFDALYNAHNKLHTAGSSITDDAMIMEDAGYTVKVVQGHKDNIKITTPEDIRYAEYLLAKNNE